ncbi:MAG: hypothetical protein ABWZ88_16755 [Variovorax sp.]
MDAACGLRLLRRADRRTLGVATRRSTFGVFAPEGGAASIAAVACIASDQVYPVNRTFPYPMRSTDTEASFVSAVADLAGPAWERIEVVYERFPWRGLVLEKFESFYFIGLDQFELQLSILASDLLVKLQEEVGASGTAAPWTWLRFALERNGPHHFEFRYGVTPLATGSLARAEACNEAKGH